MCIKFLLFRGFKVLKGLELNFFWESLINKFIVDVKYWLIYIYSYSVFKRNERYFMFVLIWFIIVNFILFLDFKKEYNYIKFFKMIRWFIEIRVYLLLVVYMYYFKFYNFFLFLIVSFIFLEVFFFLKNSSVIFYIYYI